jgi:hypothetical protein
LVWRDDHGAASDVDPHGEVKVRQALDLGDNVVVEFTADVVVERYSDGDLRIGKQLTLIWCENDSESLVVREVVGLLLLQGLGLGERVACDR